MKKPTAKRLEKIFGSKATKANPILGPTSILGEITLLVSRLEVVASQMRFGAEEIERIQRKLGEVRERLK